VIATSRKRARTNLILGILNLVAGIVEFLKYGRGRSFDEFVFGCFWIVCGLIWLFRRDDDRATTTLSIEDKKAS
jgi:uncharacterized membrane protein HdeD (DUF308 family)